MRSPDCIASVGTFWLGLCCVSDLAKYGLSDPIETAFRAHHGLGDVIGRILSNHYGGAFVRIEGKTVLAQASGTYRRAASRNEVDRFAVGDWVVLAMSGEETATLHAVLPRKTVLIRKASGETDESQTMCANIDRVFIMTALDGDFQPRRLERYMSMVRHGGAEPVVVLSKADTCSNVPHMLSAASKIAGSASVIALSHTTGEGIDALSDMLTKGSTTALVGSSGVGKSTFVNRVGGSDLRKTGGTRSKDGKGRHTSTYRELILLPNGALILDTPGMRELELADGTSTDSFEDIVEFSASCKFRDCAHDKEPGCAVQDAVRRGLLDDARVVNYRALRKGKK